MMTQHLVCPVDNDHVNSHVVRINATMVFILVLISLVTNTPYTLAILAIDFLIRGFINKPYSVLNGISKFFVRTFSIGYAKENKSPKVFAAKIGFVCCILGILFFILKLSVAFKAVVVMLLIFSFLEAAFSFCAGCLVYTALVKLKIISP